MSRPVNPLVPAYGTASLADLSSSLLAAVGVGGDNPLDLAPAGRVLLFLVDGMGAELLRALPVLTDVLGQAAPLRR